MTGRQERRRTKLLDDLKERTGFSHLKEEALDSTMWRARFERVFGPVVRQITNSYRAVNTFHLGYKNQSVYTVSGTSGYFPQINTKHISTVRAERTTVEC